MKIKTDYSRDELIAICEAAIVPQDLWADRDSHAAHVQVGTLWALLKSGCEFEVCTEGYLCETNTQTIWVDVWVRNFRWFEDPHDHEHPERNHYGTDVRGEKVTYYLPTPARLQEHEGGDWY